jgi:hypothetical protein
MMLLFSLSLSSYLGNRASSRSRPVKVVVLVKVVVQHVTDEMGTSCDCYLAWYVDHVTHTNLFGQVGKPLINTLGPPEDDGKPSLSLYLTEYPSYQLFQLMPSSLDQPY